MRGLTMWTEEYQKGVVKNSGIVFKELKLGTKRKGGCLCPEPYTDVQLSKVKC